LRERGGIFADPTREDQGVQAVEGYGAADRLGQPIAEDIDGKVRLFISSLTACTRVPPIAHARDTQEAASGSECW
jgi:hypothetical protein